MIIYFQKKFDRFRKLIFRSQHLRFAVIDVGAFRKEAYRACADYSGEKLFHFVYP
jgi:hypothetical protein